MKPLSKRFKYEYAWVPDDVIRMACERCADHHRQYGSHLPIMLVREMAELEPEARGQLEILLREIKAGEVKLADGDPRPCKNYPRPFDPSGGRPHPLADMPNSHQDTRAQGLRSVLARHVDTGYDVH